MKKFLLCITSLVLFFNFHNLCYGQCTLQADVTVSGSPDCPCFTAIATGTIVFPISYLWSNGQINNPMCPGAVGIYTLTITDALGCADDTTFTVTGINLLNATFSTTNALCLNGTATASVTGGTPPYSYLWNTVPSQTTQTATGLHANTYPTVTISDSGGCSLTQQVFISTTSTLNANTTVTPDTCSHGVGTALVYALSGAPPYSYLWSTGQTTASLTGIISSYRSVTVTDTNGCTVNRAVWVSNYSPLQANTNIIPPSCTSQTGSVTLTVTGGTPLYNYYWQTIPVQTTATATGLGIGNYVVNVTDQSGCATSFSVPIQDSSSFTLSLSATPDTCNHHHGTATAVVANGTPPYSYSWNTTPVQIDSIATGLPNGWVRVTVTDGAGCVRTKKIVVNNISLLSAHVVPTSATCILVADGGGTVNPTGGTPPFTYHWDNGSTGTSVNNLLPGLHGVHVIDTNGCEASASFSVSYNSINPCAVTIAGTVYQDLNSDCILNAEPGISDVKISCLPLGGYKWTNVNGNYSYYLPPGIYQTNQFLPPWYVQNCLPLTFNDTLPSPGMSVIDNFGDHGNAQDLMISCFDATPPVPGFIFRQAIVYSNQGTTTVNNVSITVQHDSQITFISSTPNASNYNALTRTITWNILSLYPYGTSGSQGTIYINYQVPPSLAIGSPINCSDTIFPLTGDTVIYNNYDHCAAIVVGPFDPNEIVVDPRGTGTAGFISTNDSILSYLIRFQNTGNYYARNIIVRMTIDSDLDLSTFEKAGASHPYQLTISPTGEAEFIFSNIFLPDSNSNEADSHGFVAFTIHQKQNLLPGTEIMETANIYFDFNDGVVTNTVLNTITLFSGINKTPEAEMVKIFPNPANSKLNICLSTPQPVEIELCNILGQTVKQLNIQHGPLNSQLDIAQLPHGLYFLSVRGAGWIRNEKIMISDE